MEMKILTLAMQYAEEYWFVAYLASAWLLLIGFFIYATVEASWHRLKIGIKILVAPVVIVFGLLDVIFDFVFGSIMFLEPPGWFSGRFTFSQRCEHHWNDEGLRGVIADAHCFLLNSILPGHCRK
ncbi:MAG: hypothetical protein B7Y56_03375 [Gallionellales bacterium 35-53-114]|jgi:hypothetical protein|nr:MAG: hypothetical protein B7Y56_03375 [Gallionellales bacterium 35-53-114]OYZ65146.1 MAG: hypothetical protein B7Y04_00535 [Gallionellales bacterium 24-53-125]OZB08054.1 MAG: hypothetical protein B7X61_10985 [Gallionellales bacterium 39-52-133]HQS59958.1 hypothetical protein [Gallionellaceae bacterium]HQS76660.1 hypothetical protein [Gallionellaceae bacterium]